MKRFHRWIAPSACLAAGAVLGLAAAARLAPARAETKEAGGVIVIDSREVAQAFSKGGIIRTAPDYKVMAGHRVKAGIPEVHAADTDVFYVVAGEATFVTGGTVAGAREESPGETRGTRIEGGREVALKKGDVIVHPPGRPPLVLAGGPAGGLLRGEDHRGRAGRGEAGEVMRRGGSRDDSPFIFR